MNAIIASTHEELQTKQNEITTTMTWAQMHILEAALREWTEDTIRLYDPDVYLRKTWEVHASMGYATPDEARLFATQLQLVAAIAEVLNENEITIDMSADCDMTREEAEADVEELTMMMGLGIPFDYEDRAWTAKGCLEAIGLYF